MPLPPAQLFRPPLPWVARDRGDHGTRPGALRGFVPREPVSPAGGCPSAASRRGRSPSPPRRRSPCASGWPVPSVLSAWPPRGHAALRRLPQCPPVPQPPAASTHVHEHHPPAWTDGGLGTPSPRLPALRPDAPHSQAAFPGHPRAAHCAHGAPSGRASTHFPACCQQHIRS